MKKVMLMYGYSDGYTSQYQDKRFFDALAAHHLRTFPKKDFDVIMHCWDDDQHLEEYIELLNPVDCFIDNQQSVKAVAGIRPHYHVSPRIHAWNHLHKMLVNRRLRHDTYYDLCFLRRFDLLFMKQPDLDSLSPDDVSLTLDHVVNDKGEYEVVVDDGVSKWGTERINDYFLITNQTNMEPITGLKRSRIVNGFNLMPNRDGKYFKVDMHYILCEILKALDLYDRINYAFNNPQDVHLLKRFLRDRNALAYNGKLLSGINDSELHKAIEEMGQLP